MDKCIFETLIMNARINLPIDSYKLNAYERMYFTMCRVYEFSLLLPMISEYKPPPNNNLIKFNGLDYKKDKLYNPFNKKCVELKSMCKVLGIKGKKKKNDMLKTLCNALNK